MTEEQWEGLFGYLASGGSCIGWCRENCGEEPRETVRARIFAELNRNETLANRYARVKETGIEARLDEARETARNEPDVQRARLLVDLDKWEASKLLPKKYGDRQNIELEGSVDHRIVILTKDEADAV